MRAEDPTGEDPVGEARRVLLHPGLHPVGKPLEVVLHHKDGGTDRFQVSHTLSAEQIERFVRPIVTSMIR